MELIQTEQKENVQTEQTVKAPKVFDDVIRSLREANKKIAAFEKTKDELLTSDLEPEAKREKLMEAYNAAILSFTKLPRELERACKTQKMSMWRIKEFAVKKFY